jgi:hypothetical protein
MNVQEELESSRKLLNEIAEMCEEASLTGSLSGGNRRTALRYNALLDRLIQVDAVPAATFAPLPEDAPFAEIGVEARMLSAFIKRNKLEEGGGHEQGILLRLAPFVDKSDLSQLIHDQIHQGLTIDLDGLTRLAPFLDKSMLGDLIRGRMRESPKPKTAEEVPSAAERVSEPARTATAPATAKPAVPAEPPISSARDLVTTNSREEEVGVLVDLLKIPHLTSEERSDLLERLRAVAAG